MTAPKPRLITIPISHYCERARWALDHFEVPYVEDRHLQVFHRRATGKVGAKSVPVLVNDCDEVLTDSADIVRWAASRANDDGFVVDDPLAAPIEGAFGVESRRLAYAWIIPLRSVLLRYNNRGSPWWQGALLRVGYGQAMKRVARHVDTSPRRLASARDSVDETFERVADRLSDGRPYLTGDRFTALDLTFAALGAPLVLPENYGIPLPGPDELPAGPRTEVERLRTHRAGRHILAMYAAHR